MSSLLQSARRPDASQPRLLQLPVRLADGRAVEVRAIRCDDAGLLREFDDGLSEHSRRLRYLGGTPPMSPERALELAAVDFHDRFAFVAVAAADGRTRMVADCRLARMPERPGCFEIAVAVADDFQNAGLGRVMLELTLAVAAAQGVAEVIAEVRYDNQRMMHLLRRLGFSAVSWELGVVIFACSPRPRTATRGPGSRLRSWRPFLRRRGPGGAAARTGSASGRG